jgi:hypothetical protein
MREYTRPLVLIIDDFTMREHTTTSPTISTIWSPIEQSLANP